MPFLGINIKRSSWTKTQRNTKLRDIYFCPLWALVSVNCHHRSCPLNSEILSFDIMPSISTHVIFYLMQEFAYSFNHAAANRLTDRMTWQPLIDAE